MATIDIFNMNREKVGQLTLADEVFSAEVKEHLFWEVVRWQQARRRAGSASTKTRGEISGATRKLFRQKGTGRARRGDIKSPVLRGGGRVFGPHPRDFSYNVPKKVRRQAMISALSRRLAENGVVVVDRLELPEVKTRRVVDFLKKFELASALIVDQDNEKLSLSGRNIPHIKVLPVQGLNVEDILRYDRLVLTPQAVAAIEGRLKG
ncbi:MAG: 50S ribosomal protein L4 [Deltaproteobacteria bacterium]|nr:50S ribosomal protein L4 [Deltaproteobacteria bacterium]